jgi:hypothetical protein
MLYNRPAPVQGHFLEHLRSTRGERGASRQRNHRNQIPRMNLGFYTEVVFSSHRQLRSENRSSNCDPVRTAVATPSLYCGAAYVVGMAGFERWTLLSTRCGHIRDAQADNRRLKSTDRAKPVPQSDRAGRLRVTPPLA